MEEAPSYPLLLPGRDRVVRGMIDRVTLFRNHPIDERQECLSQQSSYAGLELSLGATLISKSSAVPLWRDGKVVCRPIVDPIDTRRLFIAVSSELTTTTAQKVVMDATRTSIAESVIRKDWPDTRLIQPQAEP